MIRTIALAVFLTLPIAAAAAAIPPAGTYTYSVNHPDHGDIGTYVNTIRPHGDGVTVDTRFEVRVGIGPITLYREEADRREEWRAGRLISYDSKTVRNGEDRIVEGRAEGDRFIVRNEDGTTQAPADVWPMNPWSRDITEATVVFASASGRVYPSQVLNVGVETVRSDGRDVRARHYRVTANRKTYDLWYDEAGRLARFTAPEKGGAVTFILTDVR